MKPSQHCLIPPIQIPKELQLMETGSREWVLEGGGSMGIAAFWMQNFPEGRVLKSFLPACDTIEW